MMVFNGFSHFGQTLANIRYIYIYTIRSHFTMFANVCQCLGLLNCESLRMGEKP